MEVENETGRVVAVGRLTLAIDLAGSVDFSACSSAPRAPGWHAVRIENEAGAVLSSVGPPDPGRMTVRLDEPYTEGSPKSMR